MVIVGAKKLLSPTLTSMAGLVPPREALKISPVSLDNWRCAPGENP
jgi:hypothetical protein